MMRPSIVKFVVDTTEVIFLLRILAMAVMMLSANYSKHITVVFIVVTCGATAPKNLIGDLRLLIIGSSKYFLNLNTELI